MHEAQSTLRFQPQLLFLVSSVRLKKRHFRRISQHFFQGRRLIVRCCRDRKQRWCGEFTIRCLRLCRVSSASPVCILVLHDTCLWLLRASSMIVASHFFGYITFAICEAAVSASCIALYHPSPPHLTDLARIKEANKPSHQANAKKPAKS